MIIYYIRLGSGVPVKDTSLVSYFWQILDAAIASKDMGSFGEWKMLKILGNCLAQDSAGTNWGGIFLYSVSRECGGRDACMEGSGPKREIHHRDPNVCSLWENGSRFGQC